MDFSDKIFNPQHYLDLYYKEVKGHQQENVENRIQQWTCSAFELIPPSDSCLEIGCGPALVLAACASRKCKRQYLTDFNIENLTHLNGQLSNFPEKAAFWAGRFEVIAKLEGSTRPEIENRVKESIVATFQCDLNQDQVLSIPYMQKVDVITSSLCIECVARDDPHYKQIIGNLKKLLKPKGFIFMIGVLDETFYTVSEKRLTVYPLNENLVKEALVENNFEILQFNAERYDNPPTLVSDFKGLFSVLARRID